MEKGTFLGDVLNTQMKQIEKTKQQLAGEQLLKIRKLQQKILLSQMGNNIVKSPKSTNPLTNILDSPSPIKKNQEPVKLILKQH